MKNNLVVIATALLTCCIPFACGKNECNSNCDSFFPEISFKIVNSSGQNLTCGPNKIYTSDKISIRSYVQNVLADADKAYSGDSTSAATGILFVPASLSSQYYLYINNIKTDSFQLAFQLKEGKTECCPSFYQTTSLQLNNVAVTIPFNIVK